MAAGMILDQGAAASQPNPLPLSSVAIDAALTLAPAQRFGPNHCLISLTSSAPAKWCFASEIVLKVPPGEQLAFKGLHLLPGSCRKCNVLGVILIDKLKDSDLLGQDVSVPGQV